MRYFLIAGEASGDLHAAELIRALRMVDADADIQFIGGDKMAEFAGCKPLIHYRDMAFMGFVEVVKHLPQIARILKSAKRGIDNFTPDAVILIDYPSFNMKIAEYAFKRKIPVYYYISPKVWAWKQWRVKGIRKYVRRLFSILPFEREFFQKHNYEISYVGNPSVEEITTKMAKISTREEFLNAYQLDAELKVITLMPGSRRAEIANNLPEMLKSVAGFKDIQVAIAGAPAIEKGYYTEMINSISGDKPTTTIVFDNGYELLKYSVAALVTSGTATLETAIIGTPQVVCYRANNSRLTYWFFEKVLSVRFISLPNLIVDRKIITELLLHNCNAERMKQELEPLINDTAERSDMLNGYAQMRDILGDSNCSEMTANEIYKDLELIKNE
ncbi:MAG: lipid-A-disaccharide synthase [Bacteroidales bacterium]